jgi:hypothetical protein
VDDLEAAFGESVSFVSPAGVSTTVTAVVRRGLDMGDVQGSALDRVQELVVDVAAGALPGDANALAGWTLVVGGVTFTVKECGLSTGGMWRVVAKARVNVSLGLGRRG